MVGSRVSLDVTAAFMSRHGAFGVRTSRVLDRCPGLDLPVLAQQYFAQQFRTVIATTN
jgi:hypothetical protein